MTRNIFKYKNVKHVTLINNFNESLSSTFKCDAYIRPTICPTTHAGTEARMPLVTAVNAASLQCAPEGEHKTPINNNNTIIHLYMRRQNEENMFVV